MKKTLRDYILYNNKCPVCNCNTTIDFLCHNKKIDFEIKDEFIIFNFKMKYYSKENIIVNTKSNIYMNNISKYIVLYRFCSKNSEHYRMNSNNILGDNSKLNLIEEVNIIINTTINNKKYTIIKINDNISVHIIYDNNKNVFTFQNLNFTDLKIKQIIKKIDTLINIM